MLSKKKLIIISVIILCVFFVIVFGILYKRKNTNIKTIGDNIEAEKKIETESKYDENTTFYYIENKETGEIITASHDETDLEFYESHPDYNPNPLGVKPTELERYDLED